MPDESTQTASRSGSRDLVPTAWLIPVGAPGGLNSGFTNIADGSGVIRLGGEILVVDPELYRLWRRAASAPAVAAMLEWAAAEEIADAEEGIDALLDARLLIAESPDVSARLGELTLCVVGELLGNGVDRGAGFLVAGRNGGRVEVGPFLFELLLRSDGVTPISALCESLDRASAHLGIGGTLNGLCESLPVLVRNDVVRLDETGR
jgi:hypothetical protein